MKLWIARDESGGLWMFESKPIKVRESFTQQPLSQIYSIDDNLFPEVTFENSPMEVEIVLKNE